MGIYDEQVLPRIINVVCAMKVMRPLRQRVCEGLHGQVVELGFGSGLNIPYYPETITSVAAIEPADTGWKLAGKRLAGDRCPGRTEGPRRPVAAAARRQLRHRPVHLHVVHHP